MIMNNLYNMNLIEVEAYRDKLNNQLQKLYCAKKVNYEKVELLKQKQLKAEMRKLILTGYTQHEKQLINGLWYFY